MTPPPPQPPARPRRVLVLGRLLGIGRLDRLMVLGHPGPTFRAFASMLCTHPEMLGPGTGVRYTGPRHLRDLVRHAALARRRRFVIERLVFDLLETNPRLPDARPFKKLRARWLFVIDDPRQVLAEGAGPPDQAKHLADRLDRLADHAIELSPDADTALVEITGDDPAPSLRAVAEWLRLRTPFTPPPGWPLPPTADVPERLAETHRYALSVIRRHARDLTTDAS